jgi:hypothetical protein
MVYRTTVIIECCDINFRIFVGIIQQEPIIPHQQCSPLVLSGLPRVFGPVD